MKQPATPQPPKPDLSHPTAAGDLAPVLTDQYDALRSLFGG